MDHLIIPFHSKKSSKRLHYESWQVHRTISGTVRAEQKNTTHTSSTHIIYTHSASFLFQKFPVDHKRNKIYLFSLPFNTLSLLTSLTTVYSLISLPIFSFSLSGGNVELKITETESYICAWELGFVILWCLNLGSTATRSSEKEKNAVDEVSGTERVQFGGSGAVQSSW